MQLCPVTEEAYQDRPASSFDSLHVQCRRFEHVELDGGGFVVDIGHVANRIEKGVNPLFGFLDHFLQGFVSPVSLRGFLKWTVAVGQRTSPIVLEARV